LLKRLKPKSEFSRNVVTLMTGTAIAQAIPVFVSPILTRLYSPEDFGTYASYLSVAVILASVSMFRYEQAIMLPKSTIDALSLLQASFKILVYFMFFLFIIFCLIGMFGLVDIKLLILVIGMTFVSSFISLYTVYLNRVKKYKVLSKLLIQASMSNALLNVAIGVFFHSPFILFSNIVTSKVFSVRNEIKNFIKLIQTKISKPRIYANLKKYDDMIKFSAPSALVQAINRNILVVYLTVYFDPALAGGYFLMQRVLGSPISIFSSSFGQVFFKEFTDSREKAKLLLSTWIKLAIVVFPIAILLFFVLKPIILFVFGSDWLIAAEMAKILLPYYAVYFIFSTTSRSHITLRLQHISLLFSVIDLIVRLLIMLYGISFKNGMVIIGLFVTYDILQMLLMNVIAYKKALK